MKINCKFICKICIIFFIVNIDDIFVSIHNLERLCYQLIKIFDQEGISVVFVADVFGDLDIRNPSVESDQLSQEYQILIQNPVEASSIVVTQDTYLEKIDITDNIDKRVKILEDTNKKLEERIEQLEKIIKTLM